MSGNDRRRLLAALVLGTILFTAAVSNTVYEITSPSWLSWHVFLRKGYSIIAFAILAALLVPRRLDARVRWLIPAILALYSAAIELGQWLHGTREGLLFNAFDVGCGAVGGILGLFAIDRFRRKTP